MSNAAREPVTSGFSVTGQIPTKGRDVNGNIVDGWQVNYVTGGGVAGSIWVPNDKYNEPSVRALLVAQVAKHDAIGKIAD